MHGRLLITSIRYYFVYREIRASFNKIVTIPPEIGKLKRLRRLIVNSNRIKRLPDEIGNSYNSLYLIIIQQTIVIITYIY